MYGTWHDEGYAGTFCGGDYSDPKEILSDYEASLRLACKKSGYPMDAASWSVWEYVPGTNFAVVADSGAIGRYHIYEDLNGIQSHRVANIRESGGLATDERLIAEYERIRNLDRFDPSNCPVMEFQLGKNYPAYGEYDGKWFFLQYLRTRNSAPATFSLRDYRPEEDEREARLVRGTTPPEGVVVDFGSLFYGSWDFDGEDGGVLSETDPNGFFFQTCDNSLDISAIEKVAGKTGALCMIVADVTDLKYGGNLFGILHGHAPRSFLHKPELSVVMSEYDARFFYRSFGILRNRLKVRVLSDGNRAFLKLITKPSDE